MVERGDLVINSGTELEKCWLFDNCPCRTAVCRCSQPEDDGCPIYRRFKAIFDKQGLLKS